MGAGRFTSVDVVVVVDTVVVAAKVLLVVVVVVVVGGTVVGGTVARGAVVGAYSVVLWDDANLCTQRPSLVAQVPGAHLQAPASQTVGPRQAGHEVLALMATTGSSKQLYVPGEYRGRASSGPETQCPW